MDSFSDRICDDLCEDILKWLPIEDKLRHTAVSKQFMRCLTQVITRDTRLTVDDVSDGRCNYKNLLNKCKNDFSYEVDIRSLVDVLRRMRSIEDIHFDRYITITNSDEVLTAVIDNCSHRLKSFEFNFTQCAEDVMKRFGQRFGQSLTSIKYIFNSALNPLLNLCPNLTTISGNYYQSLDQILVNYSDVTHLDIDLGGYIALRGCLQLIPKMTKLKKLSIKVVAQKLSLLTQLLSMEGNDNTIDLVKSVQTIALYCKRMTSFSISFDANIDFNVNQFMQCFQHFSHLRQLGVQLDGCSTHELDIKCLNSCYQLTHLTLYYEKITDSTVADIETVVPQLKSLVITTEALVTETALKSISKLERLKSFKLEVYHKERDVMSDSGLIALIESCVHLNDIRIVVKMDITVDTYDAIIGKALKNPKSAFTYHLPYIESNAVKTALESDSRLVANIHICYL